MPQQWIVRRTFAGALAPLSCAAGAGVLLGASRHITPAGGSTAMNLIICAAVCLIGAAALEVQVRRQLALARCGEPAEAIIDQVIDHRWNRDGGVIAQYHFFTPTGQWINGKCHVDSTDALTLSSGVRREVLYDPANPKRNQLLLRLWGVEYEKAVD